MHKAVVRVCRWFASEHGFAQLSPEAQVAAWKMAGLAHVLILLVTLWDIAIVPALTASVRDIVILHFMLALLAAKFVEIFSALREILKLPPPGLVSSGWFFAFAVTLQPLLLFSFLMWALG